jgi:hypothetical protein
MRVRCAVRLVRVFGLNSSNQRRAVDVVSPHSDHFARDRQKTHNWPAGNLFLCLPDPWPEISTENSGGMLARLANSVQNASLALELDGRVSLPTHNFEMTLSTIDQRLRGHGPGQEINNPETRDS